MSRKRDISKEEIAKQFLLPERQSKIDTLLKQDGQAYCICRSSNSSRFMVACDAYDEWYHGDCIKISEKEAKLIRQYFCIRCKEEDSTLVTRWKTKGTEMNPAGYEIIPKNTNPERGKIEVRIRRIKRRRSTANAWGVTAPRIVEGAMFAPAKTGTRPLRIWKGASREFALILSEGQDVKEETPVLTGSSRLRTT